MGWTARSYMGLSAPFSLSLIPSIRHANRKMPTTLALTEKRPTTIRLAIGAVVVAAAALVFQAVHFVEHGAQLGYWFAHPAAPPWMTPWAMEGVYALTIGGNTATGVELLHLVGNIIFLGGLGALAIYCSAIGIALKDARNLRMALIVQSVHVLEHVLLTATVLLAGTSIGVTTFFGLVEGPVMTTWRIWAHFLFNLVASWYALRVVLYLRAEKRAATSGTR